VEMVNHLEEDIVFDSEEIVLVTVKNDVSNG